MRRLLNGAFALFYRYRYGDKAKPPVQDDVMPTPPPVSPPDALDTPLRTHRIIRHPHPKGRHK